MKSEKKIGSTPAGSLANNCVHFGFDFIRRFFEDFFFANDVQNFCKSGKFYGKLKKHKLFAVCEKHFINPGRMNLLLAHKSCFRNHSKLDQMVFTRKFIIQQPRFIVFVSIVSIAR